MIHGRGGYVQIGEHIVHLIDPVEEWRMIQQTENGFREAILQDPLDWDRMRVFADWLESELDGREDEAFCWRWMAHHKKRPFERLHYDLGDGTGRAVPKKWRWGWYLARTPGAGSKGYHNPVPDWQASLPRPVFISFDTGFRKFYGNFFAAVKDLERGLKRMRDALRID